MVWIVGAVLSVLVFLSGIIIALLDRGKPTAANERPAVPTSESMRRVASYRHTAQASSTASYSWSEIHTAIKHKQWRLLAPVAMMASGMLGLPLFGGLTLLTLDDGLQLIGLVLLVIFVAMSWKISRLFVSSKHADAAK